MDFNLTDIQQDFLKLAHDFGEKKLAPTVTERDHKGIYDKELIDELLSLGITGAYFEEKYGGSGDDGGDVLSYILAVEELAKYDAGVAITLSATVSLCANPIWQFGTEAQKEKFLVPLVEGTKLGAFGLTEPNAGTDASGQQTIATKNDDGTYSGRTRYDDPEIDDGVILTSDTELQPGDIVYVKITDAFDYDLTGERIEK